MTQAIVPITRLMVYTESPPVIRMPEQRFIGFGHDDACPAWALIGFALNTDFERPGPPIKPIYRWFINADDAQRSVSLLLDYGLVIPRWLNDVLRETCMRRPMPMLRP